MAKTQRLPLPDFVCPQVSHFASLSLNLLLYKTEASNSTDLAHEIIRLLYLVWMLASSRCSINDSKSRSDDPRRSASFFLASPPRSLHGTPLTSSPEMLSHVP